MKKRILAAAIAAVCLTTFVSCGVDKIDISGYSNSKITLTGLSGKAQTITVEQLQQLKCATVKTSSTSDKVGTVRATGPWLSTFLERYGKKQADVSKLIIHAKDGYSITLYSDFLKKNQIMLAFGIDGKPLGSEDQPVRIIIPGSDSAYWVRMVDKLELVME